MKCTAVAMYLNLCPAAAMPCTCLVFYIRLQLDSCELNCGSTLFRSTRFYRGSWSATVAVCDLTSLRISRNFTIQYNYFKFSLHDAPRTALNQNMPTIIHTSGS